ncbi:hypothetical protein MHEI_44330 [Mycobacterium heidelbergense]|nr:hypothetical protein MHEI_44330 [Mycobacterium heidelbergense]
MPGGTEAGQIRWLRAQCCVRDSIARLNESLGCNAESPWFCPAQTFPAGRPDTEEGSPFLYVDTASTRAGITAINAKSLATEENPLMVPSLCGLGLVGRGPL